MLVSTFQTSSRSRLQTPSRCLHRNLRVGLKPSRFHIDGSKLALGFLLRSPSSRGARSRYTWSTTALRLQVRAVGAEWDVKKVYDNTPGTSEHTHTVFHHPWVFREYDQSLVVFGGLDRVNWTIWLRSMWLLGAPNVSSLQTNMIS